MYGVLIEDKVIQIVNISGMVVQIICVNVFVRYSNQVCWSNQTFYSSKKKKKN